jgi:hypothetical protein
MIGRPDKLPGAPGDLRKKIAHARFRRETIPCTRIPMKSPGHSEMMSPGVPTRSRPGRCLAGGSIAGERGREHGRATRGDV